ncbi:MAG TPA: class I SAM-dependent methyltransferase [Gemmatimonadales bacterium]|nr:class I SAM-dependent methyltransferase [Gemmatimonadales bacterium]
MTTAADRWREELAAWAIPQELLDAVTDSPYAWPPQPWRRAPEPQEDEPTTRRIGALLGETGSLLDVGAGTGRISLPFAARGHRVTAVEKDQGMAEALRAAAQGVARLSIVEQAWPDAAARAGMHDVVVSAHVVYDVAEITPFIVGLHRAAGRGVVLEVTRRHPWAPLAPLFRALHGLGRPQGPTVGDLIEVIREAVAVNPSVEQWAGTGALLFGDREELLAFYQRRLVLPAARRRRLEELLAPLIVEEDGWVRLDLGAPEVVTLWWGTQGGPYE